MRRQARPLHSLRVLRACKPGAVRHPPSALSESACATDTLFSQQSKALAVTRWGRHHRAYGHGQSSLGLGGTGGFGKLEQLSEGCLLVGVAEESLLLDDGGGVVNVASKLLNGGGWVGLGAGLSLGDTVLLLVLQSHDESSLEILGSIFLSDGDANSVGGLGSVVLSINGEGAVGPVLSAPLGLLGVEILGNSPDNVL